MLTWAEWAFSACRLELGFCSALQQLPDSLCGLPQLAELDLSWCEHLRLLPPQLGQLSTLSLLNLSGCEAMVSLPDTFTLLSGQPATLLDAQTRPVALPKLPGNTAAACESTLMAFQAAPLHKCCLSKLNTCFNKAD